MKICTVVGARPQFIKAAALSRVLRNDHQEVLIHTGQHYDYNMSDVFFEELGIPHPDYNLNISGGTHGQMTGKMLPAIEEVLLNEKPDMLLVYGDTNSTLAGALAAIKQEIPVCHVESGPRTGLKYNPEEINRTLTDHIAHLLLCCTQEDVENLAREGIVQGVHFTGDLMYDAAVYYSKQHTALRPEDLVSLSGEEIALPDAYYLLTCHRQENTQDKETLFEILSAAQELDHPVLYPVHPRSQPLVQSILEEHRFGNIILAKPVGYLTSLFLVRNAEKIMTDSGGVQREAWFFKKQGLVLNDGGWPQVLAGNICQQCVRKKDEILKKLSVVPDFSKHSECFGDGHAAEKTVRILNSYRG